ncbi:hypothetical protein F5148DRAFT_989077 [Russula earlei]|uniref:Uncharacterized protein n=1 Tax=Russula earlei TaxID=71964 RepID=A0ACC0TS79_9AGAM|nr:hypothetical protein F5148DRAFT_989077 [Russula earlei]
MKQNPIYTIGHGTRKIDEFVNVLKNFGIQYLVDVRSRPYSKFNPQFNRDDLAHSLSLHGITYVFMGDTLGGRPPGSGCYTNEGKVDYEKVKTKAFFQKGIERLQVAYNKSIPLAIMCSESKPSECHRSRLIGQVLAAEQIIVHHIDEKNTVKTQAEVISEVNKEQPGATLFSAD